MKQALKFLTLAALALALAGCASASQALPTLVLNTSAAPAKTPTPGRTLQPGQTAAAPALSGGVVASGNVAAARQSAVASAQGGRVLEVDAQNGDQVKAGQVLVKLSGSEKLAAALESANVQLLTAQQAVKALNDNAGQALAQAELRLANAQKAQDDAQRNRDWRNFRNGSQTQVTTAQADLILANDRLQKAQDAYTAVQNQADDSVVKAGALSALAAAQAAHDRAQTNLAWLQADPNPNELLTAQAALDAAKAETGAAQRQVDTLKSGPDPDALALAQEQVKNAQAQLAAAQAALDDLVLKAPFDGTVARLTLQVGDWATPGQPILTLVDLSRLTVKTTDLSERDVPSVTVGQKATVQLKALNQQVSGKVTEIASLADTLGGDVVYQVTVELDSAPAGLRPGMTADVRFGE